MQLPTDVEHAVRILQHAHKHADNLQTTRNIADATGIAYAWAMKLATQLAGKGLLASVMGRRGGYTLGRPADKISLYDVYKAIEGDLQISVCIESGRGCTRSYPGACGRHMFFCEMQAALIEELSETSIADLEV